MSNEGASTSTDPRACLNDGFGSVATVKQALELERFPSSAVVGGGRGAWRGLRKLGDIGGELSSCDGFGRGGECWGNAQAGIESEQTVSRKAVDSCTREDCVPVLTLISFVSLLCPLIS